MSHSNAWGYKLADNSALIDLDGAATGIIHLGNTPSDKLLNFFRAIGNPNYPAPDISAAAGGYRPMRSESFILMSAGFDGVYGTADDVFNFEVPK